MDPRDIDALAVACKKNDLRTVRALVKSCPTASACLDDLLREAAWLGHQDMVEMIIGMGGDPNAVDSKGWTAAMWAQRYGQSDVLKLLGATLTPSQCDAVQSSYEQIGVDGDELLMAIACMRGDERTARRLLNDQPGLARAVFGQDWTPMFLGAYGGHTEIVRLLMECGIDPFEETLYGESPHSVASAHGQSSVLALMEDSRD